MSAAVPACSLLGKSGSASIFRPMPKKSYWPEAMCFSAESGSIRPDAITGIDRECLIAAALLTIRLGT